MTITAQTSKTGPYNGNGTTTVFSYTFEVQDEAHLVVDILGIDGLTVTRATLTTDYTVTGVGNAGGGTVVMITPPATGERLTITRAVPIDQEIDLENRRAVSAEVLEDGFDKLTQIAQDHQEQLDRALKIDLFDQTDLDQLALDLTMAPTYAANALASAQSSQAWAEGTEPGGAGTYSSKEWSETARANTEGAEAAQLAAEAARDGSVDAKNAAVAAAEASGDVVFFDTKAAATAALGGLAEGQVVEIFADESQGGRVTRYRVESSALVLKVVVTPIGRTIYLDPTGGSDGNDGLTPTNAVATLSVALGLLSEGDTLLIKAGSRFFERLYGMPNYTTIGRYGDGEDPIFDQSREIPTGSWVAHPTVAGVWYADVTHEVITSPGTAANNTHFSMWSEWPTSGPEVADPAPYWSAADIAANVAYIAANPGLFTCHRQGSTVKDPRLDSASTDYRYYVYPPNGEDPSAGDIVYFYGEYQQVASLARGVVAQDMIWQRSASKDLSGHNASQAARLERIRIYGASIHGWVGGVMLIRDCYAKQRSKGGDYLTTGGGGWHVFNAASTGVSNLERCEADGFANSYYMHSGAGQESHLKVRYKDCISRNATAGALVIGDNLRHGVHVDNMRSINDASGWQVTEGSLIENSSYIGPGVPFQYVGRDQGAFDARNCVVIQKGTSANQSLVINQTAQATNNAAHRCTARLKNVTNVGKSLTSSLLWRLVHFEFTDCVLGQLQAGTQRIVTIPWASITATNTQLQICNHSLAELQALTGASGINSNCIVPSVENVLTKTADATNLTRVTIGSRIVSGTSGDNTITASFQDFASVNEELVIVDYDGAGNDFVCRVTAINSTASGGTFEVTPAPDATFSSKAVQRSMWGKLVWPSGTTGITAVFSNDGTQAYLSDVSGISVGTLLWFGGIGRRDDIGPRKITALTGQTATLDRAVEWWREDPSNHTSLLYDTFGATGNIPRPSFTVEFGFPLRGEPNGGASNLGPTYEITFASPLTGSATGQEGSGTGGRARFTGGTPYFLYDGSSGNTGQILHELGEIRAGFHPIGVGDTIEISAVAHVAEFAPKYASNPVMSGRAELADGSYIASLGIGATL